MSEARKKALEDAAAARKHVVQRGEVGFNYRPTPPSGPPPRSVGSWLQRARHRRG